MLLAQESRYLGVHPLRVFAPEGTEPYVVTDCGSWEMGEPLSIEELVEFSLFQRADAVVLPDKGGDGERTRELVHDSMEYWNTTTGLSGCVPIAAVQSVTYLSILEDLEEFAKMGIHAVGIPSKLMRKQWRVKDGRTRLTLLYALANVLEEYEMEVHLLGLMENPRELYYIAADRGLRDLVVSVDTASALRWAFFDHPPTWWPNIQVPRWTWESLTERDISSEVWERWATNRATLDRWAEGRP
jgi:hypothetical protein